MDNRQQFWPQMVGTTVGLLMVFAVIAAFYCLGGCSLFQPSAEAGRDVQQVTMEKMQAWLDAQNVENLNISEYGIGPGMLTLLLCGSVMGMGMSVILLFLPAPGNGLVKRIGLIVGGAMILAPTAALFSRLVL